MVFHRVSALIQYWSSDPIQVQTSNLLICVETSLADMLMFSDTSRTSLSLTGILEIHHGKAINDKVSLEVPGRVLDSFWNPGRYWTHSTVIVVHYIAQNIKLDQLRPRTRNGKVRSEGWDGGVQLHLAEEDAGQSDQEGGSLHPLCQGGPH